jgi:hypothetical protein
MLMWQIINEERENWSIIGRYYIIAQTMEKIMSNKSCTHVCIEILQINKYISVMILLHDTIHYRGPIIH